MQKQKKSVKYKPIIIHLVFPTNHQRQAAPIFRTLFIIVGKVIEICQPRIFLVLLATKNPYYLFLSIISFICFMSSDLLFYFVILNLYMFFTFKSFFFSDNVLCIYSIHIHFDKLEFIS